MGRVNTPILTNQALNELENGLKMGKSHAFRARCQLILLKSENRKSKEVGEIVKLCEMTVNNWLLRYKNEGIKGLETRKGRGRKPLLSREVDSVSILKTIKENRQRLKVAKAEWEAESGKSVSRSPFRLFLKALAENTNEFEKGARENH